MWMNSWIQVIINFIIFRFSVVLDNAGLDLGSSLLLYKKLLETLLETPHHDHFKADTAEL